MAMTTDELEERLRAATTDQERIVALNALGSHFLNTDGDRAESYATEAMNLARRHGIKGAVGRGLQTLGGVAAIRADYPQAIEHFQRALRIYEKLDNRRGTVAAINNLASIHGATGNHALALELLERSVALQDGEDPQQQAHTLYLLAMSHGQRGNFGKALEALERALEIYRKSGDTEQEGAIHLGIGIIYGELGGYARALEHFQHALTLEEAAGNRYSASLILSNIALVHGKLGSLGDAIAVQRRAIDIALELDQRRELGLALINLGLLLIDDGRPADAIEHLSRGIAICDQIGDRHNYPSGLATLAEAYQALDRLEEARETISRSLEIQEETGERAEVAKGLYIRGCICFQAGRTDEAIADLELGLGMAEELGNLSLTARIHRCFADIFRHTGDLERALDHFRLHAETSERAFRDETERRTGHLQLLHEIERTRAEAETYRLRSEQMEREMELQNRHLTTMTMSLAQQNEFLQTVRGEIIDIAGDADGARARLRRLAAQIRAQASSNEGWKAFEEQFEKLHADFIRRLSERHPTLTPTELKVAALLKLSLSSKDIASILCVTVRCAETHRYNIRRKLQLPAKTNLTTFFTTM